MVGLALTTAGYLVGSSFSRGAKSKKISAIDTVFRHNSELPLPIKTDSGVCRLLVTSVHKIGDMCQHNLSLLSSCLHERGFLPRKSRTGKPPNREQISPCDAGLVEKLKALAVPQSAAQALDGVVPD